MLGEIFIKSPDSIFPRSLSAIVINGSRVLSKFAILAATRSPAFNFELSSSACAEKSRPKTSEAGKNPT